MQVLVVAKDKDLGRIWARHIERQGPDVDLVTTRDAAVDRIAEAGYAVIVVGLDLDDGSAFEVTDYAAYRHPEAKIVFVGQNSFFSDGSIFRHIPNAAACVAKTTRPDDLAAVVEYHARPSGVDGQIWRN